MMRGRGGRGLGGRGRVIPGPRYMERQFHPHVPFDMGHCEQAFPRVTEPFDDKALTEALVKRNQDLSPATAEQTAITTLVTKIQTVIDALIVAPDRFESATIEEARPVGSYKKGTMLRGSNTADLVIILRTLPTLQAVSALGRKLVQDLQIQNVKEALSLVACDKGFNISSADATVRCLISTIPPNIKKLDPELHLPSKLMAEHLAAIRHVRWFEENATHTSIKALIRILKDLRLRYSGMDCLSPWLIDLLAHHAVMSNPTRTPLPLNQAFRRVFALLAAGIFLPGSIGILDPCEVGNCRAHVQIPLEQMDLLCMTGQTLVRVLAHGGYKQVLQLEGAVDVVNTVTQWNDVIVNPAQPIYQKLASGESNLEDDLLNGDQPIEY